MKELISFCNQHMWLITFIIATACVLAGRIWSDSLNWGEITDPQSILRKGKCYKVINMYIPKEWTEDWIVDSIICLENRHHGFFKRNTKIIYVSGDRIRFSGDGPGIGSFYEAMTSKRANGIIVMKPVDKPV